MVQSRTSAVHDDAARVNKPHFVGSEEHCGHRDFVWRADALHGLQVDPDSELIDLFVKASRPGRSPCAVLAKTDIHQYSNDDDETAHHLLEEWVDAHQDEPVANQRNDQHTKQRTRH